MIQHSFIGSVFCLRAIRSEIRSRRKLSKMRQWRSANVKKRPMLISDLWHPRSSKMWSKVSFIPIPYHTGFTRLWILLHPVCSTSARCTTSQRSKVTQWPPHPCRLSPSRLPPISWGEGCGLQCSLVGASAFPDESAHCRGHMRGTGHSRGCVTAGSK